VCPRHPDRVSYVSCQRCGRPTCPQCQRPAAVGIQCVDCVRASSRGDRATRTQLGGRASRDSRPLVTYGLIGLCVLIWLGQLASPTVTGRLEFWPPLGWHEPWRFLTAAFVHDPSVADIWHIGFNMYALWIVGQYLEPLLGRARFLALYLISAVGGSVGYLLLTGPQTDALGRQASWAPTVGASGAVFGLFAALFVLNRHLGRSTSGLLVLFAINAAIPFIMPNVAWQAHVGGLVTGAACAGAVALTSPRTTAARQRLQLPLLALILVVVCALAVIRYQTLPAWAIA
jgi:membrane associated rhomboid family serine protease